MNLFRKDEEIMLPEEKARKKIDKQLKEAGWDIVSRNEYVPDSTVAVKEALMRGNTESDYLLFIEDKAIAVVEAKREENPLNEDVEKQAEKYAKHPQDWYGLWYDREIPLVYMANGKKIYFKNLLIPDCEYEELSEMHSPKKMLQIIGKKSEYGALPLLEREGLRDCQYEAEINFENSLKFGNKKNMAILATGAGKTYLACLASYRLLNYTFTNRVLFLVDRNNLARQTENEFNLFNRTEKRHSLSSLYQINRLRKESDIRGDIIISTIQKLFAVLTGQKLNECDEDAEDEEIAINENSEEEVNLGTDLKLPPDYFQFIVVDECHRSIYGKWKAVLDYFSGAKVLGLTATPTPEAFSFFNHNVIKKYTYDDSIVDGVNVPSRVYRIATEITEHGGSIEAGAVVVETSRKTKEKEERKVTAEVEYQPIQLDRTVVNRNQIRMVLSAYKDAIYTELYPEREAKWEYIPKTLIFAKDDKHATEIVNVTEEVFGTEFPDAKVPDNFVQKITYSSGDSNSLIRDLRTEKDFRIAVTVTLVATGTDVRPLEVVLFMKDVHSDVLYTQMKGRGCRVIKDDKLREVTPNADTKECYYIVDAVGVTEHEKVIPGGASPGHKGKLSLEHLLERLAHNDLSDVNLLLLRDYCSTINRRYENDALFGYHLDIFITEYGFAPRTIANNINEAFARGDMVEYVSPSHDNTIRRSLIYQLICNIPARNKLLEMQRGYYVDSEDADTLIYSGFSKEEAQDYISNFEKYLLENKDSMEALRIIYNSEESLITNSMLIELKERLLAESKQYGVYQIWKNYKLLDADGNVEELDVKSNVNALTHLIQIVRYAYKKNTKLTSLLNGYAKRFALYCGQAQRTLSDAQKDVMKQIAEYILNEGAISVTELNEVDTDLWRKAVVNFGISDLTTEMQSLSKIMLKVA